MQRDYKNSLNLTALILGTFLLTACGGSDSDTDSNTGKAAENAETPDLAFKSMSINAASTTDWTYINLDTASEVAAADIGTSPWHLAFRRTAIKLNGGVSGSGNVAAALANTPEGFYNADEPVANTILNTTASTHEAALTATYDLAELTFSTDTNSAKIQGWYNYDRTTHLISANTTNGWIVRHADGETYSKFTLSDASYTGLTVNYETQAAITTQFAGGEQTATGALAQGTTQLCLDLDLTSDQQVACNTADWDLMYEVNTAARSINIWTNGGVYGTGSGAAHGTLTATELADYTSATLVGGQDISRVYSADTSGNIFTSQLWYAYNLAGDHRLSPNFRTYLVDTDSSSASAPKYTLQITNYYSLGASGSPEIRFAQINGGN